MSCEDPTTQKDWVTNEVYFGPLPEGGLLIDLSQVWCTKLMEKSCKIMSILGQYLKPFEVAVGSNGKAYVRSIEGQQLRTMLVADVLSKSEKMAVKDVEELCKEYEIRLK